MSDPVVPPAQIAWVLIETWRDKSEHIEGIALTHEAKDAFMRGDYEPGQSRSAMPYKVAAAPVVPAERPEQQIYYSGSNEAEMPGGVDVPMAMFRAGFQAGSSLESKVSAEYPNKAVSGLQSARCLHPSTPKPGLDLRDVIAFLRKEGFSAWATEVEARAASAADRVPLLREYLQHHADCKISDWEQVGVMHRPSPECTCGLDALMVGL